MRRGLLSVSLLAGLAPLGPAGAQPGASLAEFVLPVGSEGRGLAFDGTHLYYTVAGGSEIIVITTAGGHVATITPACAGTPLGRPLGALAFDPSTPLATVWAATDDGDPPVVIRLPVTDGQIVETIDALPVNPADPFPTRINGLAFDAGSRSLLYSTALGVEVFNIDAAGGSGCAALPALPGPGLGFVQPQGDLSGHAFDGSRLFSGQPVDFSGGANIYPPPQILATGPDSPSNLFNFQPVSVLGVPLAAEDLAFDAVTFAPRCAVWANGTAGDSGRIGAFEVLCPGACPWDCGDGDGTVGTADLLALLARWSAAGPCDFDGDGTAAGDLLDLLLNWGACP